MKKIVALLALACCCLSLFAQKTQKTPAPTNPYADIDWKMNLVPDSMNKTTAGIAAYIREHFHTEQDKTRAAFVWVATHIEYDLDNMFAINFYEKPEEKINKPLRTGKGICENYAALFNDICGKLDIQSYVIVGYTRQNGFTDFIPHAWCAALVDNTWYLFDPTWGSGYISNKKFVRRINNSYYKASPASLIKSHMPFDPMWQFLEHTVSAREFYDEQTDPVSAKPFFSYRDSIAAYNKMDTVDQLTATANRIEANGVKNAMVYDRLRHIKAELEHIQQNKVINLYNMAGVDYNEGINGYNEFINYWNKQFTPRKSDPEIKAMIDKPLAKLQDARAKLAQIKNTDASVSAMAQQLTRSIDEAEAQIKEKEDWLNKYFAKNKSGRKSMFYTYKVTFFGKPIN